MRDKVAFVVSRKFNAGHYSHAVAVRNLLKDEGWRAYLYMHPLFKSMRSDPREPMLASFGEFWSIGSADLIVVLFPSVRALIDIVLARLIFRPQVIYVFHEPFESVASYLSAGFGVRRTIRVCLVSAVSYVIAFLSHKIILSSLKAEKTFRARYASINRPIGIVPLLFDDEAASGDLRRARKYISYIGTVAADHAFDEFIDFAIEASKSNWFPKFHFLVATASTLSPSQEILLAPMINSGQLIVSKGRALGNEEINGYYCESVVVWNAYKRSMQSGVLPKCYMFGTPVLICTSNESEYFINHENGVMISSSYAHEEIKDAISEVIANFPYFSEQCRLRFLESFYYKQHAKTFMNLATQ